MRLIKKAYRNLPLPYIEVLPREQYPREFYTFGIYKDLTQEEMNSIEQEFSDYPISIIMIGQDNELYYTSNSASIQHSGHLKFDITADNGKRGYPIEVFTTDAQKLNNYINTISNFLNTNQFPIFLTSDSNIVNSTSVVDSQATKIANSIEEFNEYLFSIYLHNDKHKETFSKFKRLKKLLKESDNMIPPIFPIQPMKDLRNKNQQQQNNNNQQNQQNNQDKSFQEILDQEMNKNK